MCDSKTCPKCDPGIEAFYQQKVKEIVAAGGSADWLDAKDIWYEYCALRNAEEADNATECDLSDLDNPNGW